MRGKFITIDGGDGAGKSTQVRLLGDALKERGVDVILTREIGGTPEGEAARTLFITQDWNGIEGVFIQFAARSVHVRKLIEPALRAGKWVVSDRFFDGTYAYQGYGQGVPLEQIDSVRRIALGEFEPDMTLIFNFGAAEGIERLLAERGKADRFEQMGADFHQRVNNGYAEIARKNPHRCTTIDATGTIEAVQQRVWTAVQQKFGL